MARIVDSLLRAAHCFGVVSELQWLVDPASTPSAAETLDALAALAPLLAPNT